MLAPIVPVAPGRLSISTCRPRTSLSLLASGRAAPSAAPPGGHPTTSRTGLLGYVCAKAASAPESIAPAIIRRNEILDISIKLIEAFDLPERCTHGYSCFIPDSL